MWFDVYLNAITVWQRNLYTVYFYKGPERKYWRLFIYFYHSHDQVFFSKIVILTVNLWCQTEEQIPPKDFLSHALNIFSIRDF